MAKENRHCIAETIGIITELQNNGLDYPTMVVVSYTVGGYTYEVREGIKVKKSAIKIGVFTIGQNTVPVLGNIKEGSRVRVKYDPDDPRDSYLPDNTGRMNV